MTPEDRRAYSAASREDEIRKVEIGDQSVIVRAHFPPHQLMPAMYSARFAGWASCLQGYGTTEADAIADLHRANRESLRHNEGGPQR